MGMVERDDILAEVASWFDGADIMEYPGILNKRKRQREDASLRVETSRRVYARVSEIIRSRMAAKFADPVKFLRDVADGKNNYVTGNILRQAIALANKGLLTVTVKTQIAGPWNNVVDGTTEYEICLTDKGRDALSETTEGEG